MQLPCLGDESTALLLSFLGAQMHMSEQSSRSLFASHARIQNKLKLHEDAETGTHEL
jgi:hypothetical protein